MGDGTTDRDLERRWDRFVDAIDLSPYKELHNGHGTESILDHVNPDQDLPEDVVDYLKHGELIIYALGLYNHPFEEDVKVPGPYFLFDGTYKWERYLWLYASKYHVEIPQEFIEHTRKPESRKWLEKRKVEEAERAEERRREQQRRMKENKPLPMVSYWGDKLVDGERESVSHRAIEGTDGWWYFWSSERGGRQAIVTEREEFLATGSAMSFEKLLEEFKAGRRSEAPE